ncbi:MAG: LytR/AlgR family response regulator transcription factor [Polaromonas sp.]
MNPHLPATALIAEDEPLLAAALQAELAKAWPGLRVLATVGDGLAAVAQALRLQPDVLFFDIQMPGQSGLDAAVELADVWGLNGAPTHPFPALVFVTAYDHYAVQAFDTQVVDYLLKPVQAARLHKTLSKVQLAMANHAPSAMNSGANATDPMAQVMAQLRGLLAPAAAPVISAPLQMIQASLPGSLGNTVRLLPVAEVLYFEAADKYVRVVTQDADYLIRTPLKELLPQLDPHSFWQIHRGTVVRASAVHTVQRQANGQLSLLLRGRAEALAVSRLYSHLFKPM